MAVRPRAALADKRNHASLIVRRRGVGRVRRRPTSVCRASLYGQPKTDHVCKAGRANQIGILDRVERENHPRVPPTFRSGEPMTVTVVSARSR
jgi:hypothetical protein